MRALIRPRLLKPKRTLTWRPATRSLHAVGTAEGPFTASIEAAKIRISPSNITKQPSAVKADNLTFDSRYLRDWCSCSQCRHPDTNQRLLDTFSLPVDLHAKSLRPEPSGLRVTWSDQVGGEPHQSVYAWDWLESHSAPKISQPETTYWTAAIAKEPPVVGYQDVMHSDHGIREWVNKIREFGFCYVDGCPVDPVATQHLIERIAFIRHTHYGGFWDFTADLSSKDTAYTTLELPVHTDTTYFSDPAGLQMFHLLSHTEGQGGESLLTDGFGAAKVLQEQDSDAVKVLSEVQITAHATGNDDAKIITTQPFPVIQQRANGQFVKIRWNNDDRGSFAPGTAQDDMSRWYEAARKFKNILEDPQYKYRSQLQPGRPMIFDNWRVLHGRTAFNGKRRLCGAYINMDDFLSRWRTLNMGSKEIAASI